MHSETTLPPPFDRKYSAIKKTQLLRALKRLKFSGRITWATSDQHEWTLFFNLGHIVYGTGGMHTVRRWQRHLISWCPGFQLEKMLEDDFSELENSVLSNCWEYQLLHSWSKQNRIPQYVANQIIKNVVTEILFDLTQAIEITYKIHHSQAIAPELLPIHLPEEEIFATVQNLWQAWFDANLEDCSPNLAPVIRVPEQVRASTSPQTYQMLMVLLDGNHTLRDVAIKTHREILQLNQALQPYIQLGWVEFINVADHPCPPLPAKLRRGENSNSHSTPRSNLPLIACIDDSAMVCQSMEQVIKAAGYQFIGIMDASRAIATLLSKKPDLIFLDLIMPKTNGYEICSQLRKVSLFKTTPIIILTGNDGLVDQVRARLLGASDFLSKPAETTLILSTIRKHLEETVLA